jgi:hypothetical protein
MSYPVWAKLKEHTDGQQPEYEQGMVLAEAVMADVTEQRADAAQWGDGRQVESDNSVTGGDVTIEVTHLDLAKKATIKGMVQSGTGGEYELTDAASPYGGLGYIDILKRNGVLSYVGKWIYKLQLGQSTQSSRTKEGTNQFTGATLNGPMLGIYTDDTGAVKFMVEKHFTTESDAKAWLNAKAGITATQAAQA